MVGLYSDDIRVDLLEPGDAFGEGAVLTTLLSRRLETATAEVRCVVHSLTRESLVKAAASFPQVQGVLEAKVLAMLQKRSEEKRRKREKQEAQELQEGGEKERPEMLVVVDVMQARGLEGKKEVHNANFYCLLVMHVPCEECSRLLEGKPAEKDIGKTSVAKTSLLMRTGSRRSMTLKRLTPQPRTSNGSKEGTKEGSKEVGADIKEVDADATADAFAAMLVGGTIAEAAEAKVNLPPLTAKAEGKAEGKTEGKDGPTDTLIKMSPKMMTNLRLKSKLARKNTKNKSQLDSGNSLIKRTMYVGGGARNEKVGYLKDFGVSCCCAKCKIRHFATQPKSRNLDPNWNEHHVFKVDTEEDFAAGRLYAGVYHKGALVNEHIAGLKIKYRNEQMRGVHWWSLNDKLSKEKKPANGSSYGSSYQGSAKDLRTSSSSSRRESTGGILVKQRSR
jgi:hypothetical protein